MAEKEKKIKIEGDEAPVKDIEKESSASVKGTTESELSDEKSGEGKEHSEAEETGEEPKDPLAEAQEQIAKLKDTLLRTMAEFDNYKKRTLKEKADLILNGSEKTVTAILPVMDDVERAIKNADKAENVKKLEEGWELIAKKLEKTLESLGVKKINTRDADFDTDYHEAVAMVPGMGDDKKGKVIDCVQTGYMLNDKVIRHAKVAVGQ